VEEGKTIDQGIPLESKVEAGLMFFVLLAAFSIIAGVILLYLAHFVYAVISAIVSVFSVGAGTMVLRKGESPKKLEL
jgi:hypothetical protein